MFGIGRSVLATINIGSNRIFFCPALKMILMTLSCAYLEKNVNDLSLQFLSGSEKYAVAIVFRVFMHHNRFIK